MQLEETFKKVKRASKSLALLSDQQRNEMLLAVADAIIDQQERILAANAADLAKMDAKNPLYDRLQLTEKRLADIAGDMRNRHAQRGKPAIAIRSRHKGEDTVQRTAPAPCQRALRRHRHDLRGSSQRDLRRLLALLQERQRLCAEGRKRCRPVQPGIGSADP